MAPGVPLTSAVRYVCAACGAEEPLDTRRWRCGCGHHFALPAGPGLDPARLPDRPPGLWRYREAIPLPAGVVPVSLGEPATPLVEVELDGGRPHLKLDYLFPTGSYKDRGATVLVSLVRALGVGSVVEDSSGNAASAIAAYCAAAGIACAIYVPASASPGKLRQIAAYGATLHAIPGSREDVSAAAGAAAAGAYYASHYWNPFFHEGVKTLAFELWEQLAGPPDAVVVPCGHGSLVLGAARGFAELAAGSRPARRPRLIAVQAAAVAPLHRMFHQRLAAPPELPPASTTAEGIATRRPLRWREILAAVHDTGGTVLAVSEAEIAGAQGWAAGRGFYVEPTAAVPIAGYRQAVAAGALDRDERVVVVLTGHGLKAAPAPPG